MKNLMISGALVLGLLTAGCEQLQNLTGQATGTTNAGKASATGATAGTETKTTGTETGTTVQPTAVDAKDTLALMVLPMIPLNNPKVGVSAKIGTEQMEWAIVGEKDNCWVVEYRLNYGPKPLVIAHLVEKGDKSGKVEKAYGGPKDGVGVELPVPVIVAPKESKEGPKIATRDLAETEITTKGGKFKAKGTEILEGMSKGTKTWMSETQPFQGGMVKLEDASGKTVVEVIEFKTEGAKPTLTLASEVKQDLKEKKEDIKDAKSAVK